MAQQLNPAVVQAVDEVLRDVVGPSRAGARGMAGSVGAGNAYQMVAQSSSLAIQNSVDFLAANELMTQATTAVVLAKLIAGQPVNPAALLAAQEALTFAVSHFAAVGATATTIASTFPSQ